jgi:hypothetical protein
MKDLKHIKRFNESSENLNISDVSDSKINESMSVEDRLEKIERMLNEITDILREFKNEIEDDGYPNSGE